MRKRVASFRPRCSARRRGGERRLAPPPRLSPLISGTMSYATAASSAPCPWTPSPRPRVRGEPPRKRQGRRRRRHARISGARRRRRHRRSNASPATSAPADARRVILLAASESAMSATIPGSSNARTRGVAQAAERGGHRDAAPGAASAFLRPRAGFPSSASSRRRPRARRARAPRRAPRPAPHGDWRPAGAARAPRDGASRRRAWSGPAVRRQGGTPRPTGRRLGGRRRPARDAPPRAADRAHPSSTQRRRSPTPSTRTPGPPGSRPSRRRARRETRCTRP